MIMHKRRFGVRSMNKKVGDMFLSRSSEGITTKAQRRNAITKYSNSCHRKLIKLLKDSAIQERMSHNTELRPLENTSISFASPEHVIFDEFGQIDKTYEGSNHLINMAGLYYKLLRFDMVLLQFEDMIERREMMVERLLEDMQEVGFVFLKKSLLQPGKLLILDENTSRCKIGEVMKEQEMNLTSRRRRM